MRSFGCGNSFSGWVADHRRVANDVPTQVFWENDGTSTLKCRCAYWITWDISHFIPIFQKHQKRDILTYHLEQNTRNIRKQTSTGQGLFVVPCLGVKVQNSFTSPGIQSGCWQASCRYWPLVSKTVRVFLALLFSTSTTCPSKSCSHCFALIPMFKVQVRTWKQHQK